MNTTAKVKDVLTTGEVAKICNVAPRTVSKWFDSGALHGYRIPGSKDRRIPLNQLRFTAGETNEWGFQLRRYVGRSQEESTWSPWPRSGPAIVSKFGVVDGIDHLKQGRRLELLLRPCGPLRVIRDQVEQDVGVDQNQPS